MSRKDGGNPNEGPNSGSSRQNPLYGARALLSRHLTSGATPSPGRLPSLRPARDLTLGASPRLNLGGNPKRTFAPNIPTRRIKQEPKDEPSDTPETLGEKKRRDNRGARGRGRGERGKPEIIKCDSIFSMGAGPDRQKMGSSASSYSNIGGRDSISSVKVKKERNDDIDGSDESKLVLEMLKTSGDFEENMEQGGAMPVQLPLTSHAIKKEEKEVETESMTDVKVKIEPLDVEMENAEKPLIEKKCKPLKGTAVKKEKTMDPTVLSLLNSLSPGNEKLLFFQFPDVLPMNPAAGSQDEPMVVDQQSNQQTPTKTTGGPKLSLRDASEGYIGKLQLRRSGKARLLFGQVSLDVSMGTPCGFLQDVVSVHTEENRSDMITIGHVQNRLICTPEFEHLLAS